MDYFQDRHFKIEYITGNNVLNWDNYESPLIYQSKTYHHILDFLNEDIIKNIDAVNIFLQEQYSSFDTYEVALKNYISEFFIRFSIRDLVESFLLFEEALKKLTPDVVFVLHENNFWTKSLAYQACKLGIPVVSFQEGQYTVSDAPPRFSPFHLLSEYSQKILLWGRADFDLLNVSEESRLKLRIVGVPHLDEYINMPAAQKEQIRQRILRQNDLIKAEKICLFAVPHTVAASGNIVEILKDLICFFKEYSQHALLIRFHPFESHLKEIFEPLWRGSENIRCDQISEAPDLISSIDICLCQITSFGLECLALGKPLVEINYYHSQDDKRSYSNQGVADLISNRSDLSKLARILVGQPPVIDISKSNAILSERFYKLDGKTNERVYFEVLDLLTEKI